MYMEKKSYFEMAVDRVKNWLLENKVAFFSTMLIGLLAHMFMFANKLVNHDDIWSLFQKGATIDSGRWGLVVLEMIFPNYSMPWIYGIISLVLISITVCLIVKLFHIQNSLLQVLLGGLVVSFPSQTGTFCYMFTSAPYALSLLLAVAAVVLFEKGGWRRILIAAVISIFSLSIYQAYIAVIASFFVILLIQKVITEDAKFKEILFCGIKMILFLAVVMIAYYCSVQVVLAATGIEFNQYANNNFKTESVNLLYRIYVICANILYLFTRGNWELINSPVSLAAHLLVICLVAGVILCSERSFAKTTLLVFLAAMLLLAINCMYLITEEGAVHTLVLYSYIAVYVIIAVVMETYLQHKRLLKDIALVSLTLILVNNIYFANITYLQMHIVYENAFAYYSSVITQIKQLPDFDENKKLAIIGDGDNWIYDVQEFGDNKIMGLDDNLIEVNSRDEFIKYYIGFDIPFATEEEKKQIMDTDAFQSMEEYPWYGSVEIIGEYVVVKLGEKDVQ